jgi:hypothetical protein
MSYGDGKLRGTEERSASKLPIALGRPRGTLNLTVAAACDIAEVYRLDQSSVTFPDFPEFMI